MTNVTVVLPVYNGINYLPFAVESIMQQTLTDFKLLIINDGSNDNTSDYLNSLKDSRISIIHQYNMGLGNTLNRALQLCDTRYFARMDADDISLPERLEKQLTYLESHPETVLIGTQISFLCDKNIVRANKMPTEHNHIRSQLMKGRPVICHPSVMFRTNIARLFGGYRTKGYGLDTDFFLRISEYGNIENLNKVLHYYRMNFDSIVSHKNKEIMKGTEHAIICAQDRFHGVEETSWESFINRWEKHTWFKTINSQFHSIATTAYRKGIFKYSQAKYTTYVFYMLLASFFKPVRAIELLSSYIKNFTT